jgi:glutamate racemase
MHILITDSGVGGLSVCAYAERFVRTRGFTEPVRLTFANAAPENDYGYNSMPSRDVKLQTFDRFLRNVTERFAPDSIYVACNTLSVLLPDTPYFESAAIPVKGIVESGSDLLVRELEADPRSVVTIFGTQTTIDAGTYPQLLRQRGVEPSRIISQACPGLADTISEDGEGTRTASEIRRWVGAAIEKLEGVDAPVVAYLACTHYGYRQDLFSAAFGEAAVRAKVVNPNERAVDDLFGTRFEHPGEGVRRDVDVEFVTRYAIPETTLETLTLFLSAISPRTVAAMRNFVHLPDLF